MATAIKEEVKVEPQFQIKLLLSIEEAEVLVAILGKVSSGQSEKGKIADDLYSTLRCAGTNAHYTYPQGNLRF